ncbi:MAG TPA: pentapeptide repeat-containing protein [Alphaproteobacteria bacterium]|nr:pentapeptide repeat-containing protein [Alphaproteobacteria bacterium]
MPRFTLRTRENTPLYTGTFSCLRRCLESAASDRVALDGLQLHRPNLARANLDDVRLRRGSLVGANLSGANLSESCLEGSDFRSSCFQNACLAYASLRGCRFEDALFGATDMTGTDLREARFSTPSAFSLNFTECASMAGAGFVGPDDTLYPMTYPPLVVAGLSPCPIAFLDRHVWVEHRVMTHRDFITLRNTPLLTHPQHLRDPGHEPGHNPHGPLNLASGHATLWPSLHESLCALLLAHGRSQEKEQIAPDPLHPASIRP